MRMVSTRLLNCACSRNKLYNLSVTLRFVTRAVLLFQTTNTVGFIIHNIFNSGYVLHTILGQHFHVQCNKKYKYSQHIEPFNPSKHGVYFPVRSSKLDDVNHHLSETDDVKDEKEKIEEHRLRVNRHKYWVMLVDDEEAIRLAVGRFLYESGYQVTACSDSDAALEVLNVACNNKQQRRKPVSSQLNKSRLPDIILLDVRMPGSTLNGIELLQWIRSNDDDKLFQTTPVIMLTAKGLTQDRIVGYQAGATAYLTKPFNPLELLSIIDNAILRNEQIKYSTTTKVVTINANSNNNTNSNVTVLTATPVALIEMRNDIETIKEMIQQLPQNRITLTDIFLTPAERDVLEYLGKGMTKQEIASARNVTSIQSVTRIINNLYKKTNLSTRTGLIRWAIETGYLPKRR